MMIRIDWVDLAGDPQFWNLSLDEGLATALQKMVQGVGEIVQEGIPPDRIRVQVHEPDSFRDR
jgi:hypothetical protein